MGERIRRGEIWLYTFKHPDKKRPVLFLTRDDVIPLLHTVTVAPITSTIHGAPGEVVLGTKEGLKNQSAANLDHIQTVSRSGLRTYVGALSATKMRDVCRAMNIALGCT